MAVVAVEPEFYRLDCETPLGSCLGITVSCSKSVLLPDIGSPDYFEMNNPGFLILILNLSVDVAEISIGFVKLVFITSWVSVHSSTER